MALQQGALRKKDLRVRAGKWEGQGLGSLEGLGSLGGLRGFVGKVEVGGLGSLRV